MRDPWRCDNLVKNMLTQSFEEPTPGRKIVGKLALFEKFWSSANEKTRPGEDNMKKGRKECPTNHIVWINFVYDNIMYWDLCSQRFAQESYSHIHTT